MKWEYDPVADCAYVRINDLPWARSEEVDDGRVIDYAPDGTVVGIELICIRYGVKPSGLPHQDEVERLLREHEVKVLT